MKNDRLEVCYRGLVESDQADPSGALGIEGATSIIAEALRAFLVMRQGPMDGAPTGHGAALAGFASMSVHRPGEAVVRPGELAVCSVEASSPAATSQEVTARLQGPHGLAWQAALQLTAPLPAALPDTASRASDGGWPPMRLMRTMRRQDCDQAGHVNVRVFMGLAEAAARALLLDHQQQPDQFEIVQVRIAFKRELFEGDVVAVHSGIQKLGPQGIDVVHGIVHRASGQLACVVETRLLPADADASGLSALAADWASLPPARPPVPPRAEAQPAADAVATVLSVVDAWDCDDSGRLSLRALVSLCSTGARRYLATIGLNGARFLREKISVAAVDYLIDAPRRPLLGSNLTMRSAFLSGSAKSIRFSHHLVDSDDGTVYATVEIVGVMLDLATHRSMEVPQDVKQRLGLA